VFCNFSVGHSCRVCSDGSDLPLSASYGQEASVRRRDHAVIA
jgi:hypothetical protein